MGLIVRNAETTIRECIESFIEHIDQCVVILAGESTDKTKEILDELKKQYTHLEIYPFVWVDDFSAARNFCFSKLNGDFYGWVDSDDTVYQPDNIKPLINNAQPDVGAIWLPYHYAMDEFGNVTTVYERERLLRAKFGWVWKGRLHETVSPLSPCKFVRSDEIIIKHNHLAAGSRNDRNFKLLNLMRQEDPNEKRVWLYLGHQNFAAGNWMEAAEWYLKFGSDTQAVPLERYQSLCYCSKAMREMNDKQTMEVALQAISLFPEYKDAYLELAHAYLMVKDYDKAIHWASISDIKELIHEPPAIIFVNPLEYTFNKYAMLSECYMNKGDYKQAIDYMMGAYQVRPTEDVKRNVTHIRDLETRNRIMDSIKILAITLLNNKEITKLRSLLDCTPFWFRDTDEYKELRGGVENHTSKIEDKPLVTEGDNNSVMVNIANSVDSVDLLDKLDRYDKVTVVAPYPNPNSTQIRVYSQTDIEELVTSKQGRHIINLQKESNRIICEYDKKQPQHLAVRFFLGQGLENWSPKTIREVGCGGSETAVAWTAKEMAKRDCLPYVYAMDNQVWDGVIYRSYKDFRPDSMSCHLFISSRIPDMFHNNIPAIQKWLWGHDIHFWDRLTPEIAEKIDVIIALSQWHAGHLKRVYPFLSEAEVIDMDNNKLTYDDQWTAATFYPEAKATKLPKLAIIGNGIDTERFAEITEKRIPNRFIWCSSPDRGLEEVLNMWTLIKKSLPDAELKIFYGWEYFNSSLWIPGQSELKERIRKLIQQDGVEWCGRVGQAQIAKELMKADVMLYPPPHQFRETYGIAFLEAQAAGVLCFYRKNGALGETIGSRGIALDMDMKPEEIVNTIVMSLLNKEMCEKKRAKARKYAMNRSWGRQTEKILALYGRIDKEGEEE